MHTHTHASVQSKCNTHPLHITLFSDFRKWTHTVTKIYTPSHTNKRTHYSLLKRVWRDRSMTGSERTVRVTERPTLLIPVQLSQLSVCAARRLKPWIRIGLYFTPNCKKESIFINFRLVYMVELYENFHPSWFIMHSVTDDQSLPYLCRCTIFGRDVVRRLAPSLSVILQLSPNSLRLRVTVPSGFVYSLLVRPS